MKIPHLRWLMVSLIFLATVINYSTARPCRC